MKFSSLLKTTLLQGWQNQTTRVLVLFLLALSVPLTVVVLQQQQNLKPQAAGATTCTFTASKLGTNGIQSTISIKNRGTYDRVEWDNDVHNTASGQFVRRDKHWATLSAPGSGKTYSGLDSGFTYKVFAQIYPSDQKLPAILCTGEQWIEIVGTPTTQPTATPTIPSTQCYNPKNPVGGFCNRNCDCQSNSCSAQGTVSVCVASTTQPTVTNTPTPTVPPIGGTGPSCAFQAVIGVGDGKIQEIVNNFKNVTGYDSIRWRYQKLDASGRPAGTEQNAYTTKVSLVGAKDYMFGGLVAGKYRTLAEIYPDNGTKPAVQCGVDTLVDLIQGTIDPTPTGALACQSPKPNDSFCNQACDCQSNYCSFDPSVSTTSGICRPAPTGVPSASTQLALSLIPSLGGTVSPDTVQTQQVSVQIVNTNNIVVKEVSGTVTFDSASSAFKGTLDAGTLTTGNYKVKAKIGNSLRTIIGGSVRTITANTINTLPQTQLFMGDANNDNKINVADYSILYDCFNQLASCSSSQKVAADFSMDTSIDILDYNIFLSGALNNPIGE